MHATILSDPTPSMQAGPPVCHSQHSRCSILGAIYFLTRKPLFIFIIISYPHKHKSQNHHFKTQFLPSRQTRRGALAARNRRARARYMLSTIGIACGRSQQQNTLALLIFELGRVLALRRVLIMSSAAVRLADAQSTNTRAKLKTQS